MCFSFLQIYIYIYIYVYTVFSWFFLISFHFCFVFQIISCFFLLARLFIFFSFFSSEVRGSASRALRAVATPSFRVCKVNLATLKVATSEKLKN